MYSLSKKDATQLKEAGTSFKVIVPLETLRSECDSDILKELFVGMLDLAIRYTESVLRWQRLIEESGASFDEPGTRQAIEDVRTSVHDAFNDHVNILSRMMARTGKKNQWRSQIGDSRAALGRFALTLSFEYIRQMEKKGGVS
ncbi:MAG: hypothetical protein COV01_01940 [Candidatus Taylorbacteria bacterium CG10_big_fil_rev_8_21_14_0_10_41_48]|uniref:Uncharacterized protein n=1 Tax=Candidatus Taylorbacteria bacterium CG10_big_fil_rev_8_21_14_0_10_41_48 TaxID=1975024 RepID=A0A2M8LCA5_9BACT|nr:MAG: hypothetical protein COV01_01940 [Candidatus Taylorbacteria bacterium CG10_big_fil_rev_8_21_14_0_10_41_48]